MPERRSVVIHGHFYQPPRENPWTDTVPLQPSAAPDHDWNARIARECYGPVTRARLVETDGERFVNTLEHISYNVGPTLLRWAESETPEIYRRLIDADAVSHQRLGHGNAMAQAYHHSILPLASERDKRTEVLWGLQDFRRRFGRESEGIWLPEAAVDAATLDVVGDLGVRFVIVAPHQVDPRPEGGVPGWYVTAGGARVAVIPYDGAASHAVAFGQATRDGEAWAAGLASVAGEDASVAPRLVSIATDGETYGHHHEFAEMGLAAAIQHLMARDDIVLENFATFLARNPPTQEVDIVSPSSWSCAHGVERWRSDCGCKIDPSAPTQQAWRRPLREGLESLAKELHAIYEDEAGWLGDPWAVRDAYGEVFDLEDNGLVLDALDRAGFVSLASLAAADRTRLIELLEMERNALRMFTSCGWFFDDIARLEPRQILGYAERAIELSGAAARLRPAFVAVLRTAKSNDPDWTDAAEFFVEKVLRTAALHVADVGIASLEGGAR